MVRSSSLGWRRDATDVTMVVRAVVIRDQIGV
jgi:hypothetical protein